MKNILVTDFQKSGEDVMIFSYTQTQETIKEMLDNKKQYYNEIYEVKSEELGYYIYDPCYLNDCPDEIKVREPEIL